MEEDGQMKYKAIVMGEEEIPGRYPLVKQIFESSLQRCKDWAVEVLKDKQYPVRVEIYELVWNNVGMIRPKEPNNSPPPYALKTESQKDVE